MAALKSRDNVKVGYSSDLILCVYSNGEVLTKIDLENSETLMNPSII